MQYIIWGLCTDPGKDHVNTDGLLRITRSTTVTTIPMVVTFGIYHAVAASTVCGRMNSGIMFHDEVEDIVPLAVRQISHAEGDIEPHEDVTLVEKYKA